MRTGRVVTAGLAALVAATALTTMIFDAPAAADRGDLWRVRAATALAAFDALETDRETAHAYANAAHAYAILNGWTDPGVAARLVEVYSRANPDGGYGLGYAWDAFSNGTTNPATTTYTVTLAGHVGPVLLDGYRAGVVSAERVRDVVELLLIVPRITTSAGVCLAYSRSSHDAAAGCVHNASFGAAAFLADAHAAGFVYSGQTRLVSDITRREVAAYRTSGEWPYVDSGADQDTDHNSYSAESAYRLAPPLGREAAYRHMANALADNSAAPLAHVRLAALPRYPGSPHWCVMGDAWLAELDAFIAAPPAPVATRLSQAAAYAARASVACAGT